MRAARTAQVWQWPARHAVPGQDAGTPAHTAGPRAGASLGLRPVLGLAALFLAGYVGGILYCRGSVPEPAALLAGFYMDKQNFADFERRLPGGAGTLQKRTRGNAQSG